MMTTTTPTIEGHRITGYPGIVSAEALVETDGLRDLVAGVRKYFGKEATSHKDAILKARQAVPAGLEQRATALGANAVVGVSFDHGMVGPYGTTLMVAATGTAVVVN